MDSRWQWLTIGTVGDYHVTSCSDPAIRIDSEEVVHAGLPEKQHLCTKKNLRG
jgi:hypothetical protein